MKRLMPLIMAAALLICMSAPMIVFATSGGDAHSSSMSVEADGQTVEEVQAMEGKVVDEDVDEEEFQEDPAVTDDEELAEEPEVSEEETDSVLGALSNNWPYIAAGLGAVVVIIVTVIAVKSSKNKRKNVEGSQGYKAKH